jgi:uncharacterized protein DUF1996
MGIDLPARRRLSRTPSWKSIVRVGFVALASTVFLLPTRAQTTPLGQFVIQCMGPVRTATDDPIVHPNMAGMSHLHEFYGNNGTASDSTYNFLLGQPTGCARDRSGGDPGDTAAYWHPTLFVNGVRTPVPKSTFYYTNRGRKSPADIKSFPPDLKVIAGNAMATEPQSTKVVYWGCGNGSSVSVVSSPPQCRSGDTGLTVHVIFPDCWDGVHLDSPDHKSHMAYSTDGSCPALHPVSLPYLIMRFQWTNFTPAPSDITLSSGGSWTFHADFWNSWNQARLEQLTSACIEAGRKCTYEDVDALPFPSGTPTPDASTTTTSPSSTTTAPVPVTTTAPTTTTTVPPDAPPAGTNLLPNSDFEQDLTGWSTNDGTVLAQSTDAHSGGFAAQLTRTGGRGEALLNDSPTAARGVIGVCTAQGWVKGRAGAVVVVRLREYSGGNRVGYTSVDIVLTGAWQPVAASLVTRARGMVDLDIYGRDFGTGDVLLVDDITEACA